MYAASRGPDITVVVAGHLTPATPGFRLQVSSAAWSAKEGGYHRGILGSLLDEYYNQRPHHNRSSTNGPQLHFDDQVHTPARTCACLPWACAPCACTASESSRAPVSSTGPSAYHMPVASSPCEFNLQACTFTLTCSYAWLRARLQKQVAVLTSSTLGRECDMGTCAHISTHTHAYAHISAHISAHKRA